MTDIFIAASVAAVAISWIAFAFAVYLIASGGQS